MIKVLDKEKVEKFFEMDFRRDFKEHETDWYLERVPDSFYKEAPDTTCRLHEISDVVSNEISMYSFHSNGIDHGFYCKPSWDWINPLAKYLNGKKVLDVMAGNGLISLCLKHRGVDIDACDRATGKNNKYTTFRAWDYPIMPGEDYIIGQAVNEIIYDTLLLIWPEYDGDGSDKIICDNFLVTNPNGEIIFIGENEGGCTGSKDFFEAYELEYFEDIGQHYISSWGIYDGIFKVKRIEN